MKQIVLMFTFITLNIFVFSQTYLLNGTTTGTTINTCGGNFYDSGGSAGQYTNNQNYTVTFCPSTPGAMLQLNFSAFAMETCCDRVFLYNGSTTGAAQFAGSPYAVSSPGMVTASNPSGCITVTFTSDGSVLANGWAAAISCVTYSCTDGIQNQGETGIDCGGPCVACPNCYNGIMDGNETGIDCGPSCPEPCHCSDGVLSGNETGVDCGGSCNPCPVPCAVELTYSAGFYDPPSVAGPAYNMSSGTINTCGGTFYDPNGTSNYADNQLNTMTFCSSTAGAQLEFIFTLWNLETCCDYLTIYDGPTTAAPQLFYGNGSTNPGTVTSTNGCLTFVWDSDGSVVYQGWAATINCVDAPLPFDCNGGQITLTAVGQGEYEQSLNNNFNNGSLGSGWVATGGQTVGVLCGPSLDGTPYYWASTAGSGIPQLTTAVLDVSCGGTITFDMDYATQGGPAPCEGPDLPNEGVYFQYSTNGGATWTIIQYWDPLGGYDVALTGWNSYSFAIPPAAMGPNTQFQWIQTTSSGACCDNWGVDNVVISSVVNCTPYWYNYSYLPPLSDNPIQTTNITATTTFNVTYTNGVDACSTSLTVVVPPGTTANAGPDQVRCFGGAGVVLGANPVTADNGATYSWSASAGSGTIDLVAPGITNGQVTVSPTVTTTYTLSVTFNGCTTTDQVTVVVDNPPTASNPAPLSVACTSNIPAPDITVVTTEADDITIPPTVTWISDVSNGGTCPNIVTRTYRVTDGCGNFVSVVQTITVNDNIAPTGTAPANVTVQCVANVPVQDVLAITNEADNCAVPAVTFISDVSAGTCPTIITRTYRITDVCGNFINVVQTITVQDNIFPTASNPAGISAVGVAPAPNVLLVIDEADNCSTPTVAWVSDVSDLGVCPELITRTYSVTDACGNQILVTQIISIGDAIIPTASNPAGISVQCSALVPVPNPLVVIDETDNGAIPIVTWQDDVSNNGTCPEIVSRRYRVTDDCGNFIYVTQIITINDITAPTASNPTPINIQTLGGLLSSMAVPIDVLVVTDELDNCSIPVVAWLSDVSDGNTCPEIITRTYSVTDACGNVTNVTQTITVDDNILPTASNPVAVSVECIGDVPVPNIAVVTNEADNGTFFPTVTFVSDVSDGNTCPETITRTYSVTDDCGNSINVTQTFVVNDITNPTASNPAAISVPGSMNVPAPNIADVINEADNCSVPVVAWVSDVSDGNVCNLEEITRTYSVTDACGNQILVTQVITILAVYPPIDAGPDQGICAGDLTSLTAVNPLGVPVTWDNGVLDGVPFSTAATTTYTVTANNLGCSSADQTTITINTSPVVSFTPDVTAGCAPVTVNFTNTTPNSSSDVWSISNGDVMTGIGTVSNTFNQPGCFDVTLTITGANGCVGSLTSTDLICVEANPIAAFTPSSNVLTTLDTEVTFNNTSIGANFYSWNFGDDSPLSDVTSPLHVFPQVEGGYQVMLIATSPFGCADTAYSLIEINEPLLYYVPNTFTPDVDNYNPTFQPVFTSGYDPYDFTMLIFNRWGEIIFETHDASKGWDGTYGSKGQKELVQDGTYAWKIEFKTSLNDERKMIVGHVNVIR